MYVDNELSAVEKLQVEEFLSMHPTHQILFDQFCKLKLIPEEIIFPEKELDPRFLVTLCQNNSFNCHFVVGHLMDWTYYNPSIDQDISYWKQKLQSRHTNKFSIHFFCVFVFIFSFCCPFCFLAFKISPNIFTLK